jgi:hypothetical protein
MLFHLLDEFYIHRLIIHFMDENQELLYKMKRMHNYYATQVALRPASWVARDFKPVTL